MSWKENVGPSSFHQHLFHASQGLRVRRSLDDPQPPAIQPNIPPAASQMRAFQSSMDKELGILPCWTAIHLPVPMPLYPLQPLPPPHLQTPPLDAPCILSLLSVTLFPQLAPFIMNKNLFPFNSCCQSSSGWLTSGGSTEANTWETDLPTNSRQHPLKSEQVVGKRACPPRGHRQCSEPGCQMHSQVSCAQQNFKGTPSTKPGCEQSHPGKGQQPIRRHMEMQVWLLGDGVHL